MKHLMALLALVVAVTAGAQTYYFPHNHDANHDGFIGSEDLLSLLSEYSTEVGMNADAEIPEYDFPAFEQMIYDHWSQDVIIDSIYLSFTVEGEHTWFPIGSLEAETDTIIYHQEVMTSIAQGSISGENYYLLGYNADGYFKFWFYHGGDDGGTYQVTIEDITASNQYFQSIGFLNHRFVATSTWHITEGIDENTWELDEGGWNWLPMTYWGSSNHVLTEFECIPYWHDAE